MGAAITIFKERNLDLKFNEATAKVLYHKYVGVELNSTIISFKEKRNILSTMDGFRQIKNVVNVFIPEALADKVMTMKEYAKFINRIPATLGLTHTDTTFLSTGVDMDKVAFCEKTFEDFQVCCIATGGALNNALRAGVDEGKWIEKESALRPKPGTINIILLTNVSLTTGAMARAIMTATEAKTAALEDLNYKSTASPKNQATGTGTDSMVVVSGINSQFSIKHTGGHTKMGELIGYTAKRAVEEALQKFDGVRSNAVK